MSKVVPLRCIWMSLKILKKLENETFYYAMNFQTRRYFANLSRAFLKNSNQWILTQRLTNESQRFDLLIESKFVLKCSSQILWKCSEKSKASLNIYGVTLMYNIVSVCSIRVMQNHCMGSRDILFYAKYSRIPTRLKSPMKLRIRHEISLKLCLVFWDPIMHECFEGETKSVQF